MSRLFFGLTVILFQQTACGQSRVESIYGHWKEIKKTSKDGETGRNVTFDGKDYEPSWDLQFDTNGVYVDLENDYEHSFKLEGDKLFVGKSQYIVTEITATKLVLTDYDPDDSENPFGFIHYFEKIK